MSVITDEYFYFQVRGKKYIENSTFKEMHEVTVELIDVVVSIKMYMDDTGAEEEEKREEGEGGEDGQDEYEDEDRRRASKLREKANYYLEFVGWR